MIRRMWGDGRLLSEHLIGLGANLSGAGLRQIPSSDLLRGTRLGIGGMRFVRHGVFALPRLAELRRLQIVASGLRKLCHGFLQSIVAQLHADHAMIRMQSLRRNNPARAPLFKDCNLNGFGARFR